MVGRHQLKARAQREYLNKKLESIYQSLPPINNLDLLNQVNCRRVSAPCHWPFSRPVALSLSPGCKPSKRMSGGKSSRKRNGLSGAVYFWFPFMIEMSIGYMYACLSSLVTHPYIDRWRWHAPYTAGIYKGKSPGKTHCLLVGLLLCPRAYFLYAIRRVMPDAERC